MQTGIIIIGIVILCLMGFGMRDFFANPYVHIGLRIGMGIIGGGVLWLVIRAFRDRRARARTEKTEEVKE
jgi:undecaprenyl pyrophosphate phosphatase UppP